LVRARARAGDSDSVGNGNESAGPGDETEKKESDGVAGPKDRFAVLRNALARGSARYYSNLVNASRFELGVDIDDVVDKLKVQRERVKEVAESVASASNQRAKELRAELEDARKQSQEALAEARQNYWPRFVEWNRWELWRVSI
jgi:hypothetical protein